MYNHFYAPEVLKSRNPSFSFRKTNNSAPKTIVFLMEKCHLPGGSTDAAEPYWGPKTTLVGSPWSLKIAENVVLGGHNGQQKPFL